MFEKVKDFFDGGGARCRVRDGDAIFSVEVRCRFFHMYHMEDLVQLCVENEWSFVVSQEGGDVLISLCDNI